MKNPFRNLPSLEKLLLPAAGFLITFLLLLLYVQQPLFLKFVNYKIYDTFLREHATSKIHEIPVIVDIDEKSLRKIGQWPWPRYRLALLLDKIKQAGALAVGLDILFAEADRTSPALILDDISRTFGRYLHGKPGFSGLPALLQDNDALFAQTLATGPYVLGYTFLFPEDVLRGLSGTPPDACRLHPVSLATKSMTPGLALEPNRLLAEASGAVCPLPSLSEAAPGTGFFTTDTDPDGIIRQVPLLISYNGRVYPSLALATLFQALGQKTILLSYSERGTEQLRVAGLDIPLNRAGGFLVNYHGKEGTYPYISAADILNDAPDALEALRGRIVFIGTSAAGLRDIRTTPFSQNYPGVETHATIVDNILSEDFIHIPPWAPGLEVLALLLAGLLTTLLLTWARAAWLALPLLVLAGGLWFGSSRLFGEYRYFVSPLYPLLGLALTFTLMTAIKFWREEKQKKFIHGAFAHYLAPAVIDQIVKAPESLTLEGQEKEITILFSDVRNFTSLSERLTPTQVTDLLHDYLTPMTRIITSHNGTLDKFIGDAVMAFWNAPLDVAGHQRLALVSALEQLRKLEEVNLLFLEKFGFTIRIGIGIHCGVVRVGNMGSADLFDYTLIGDSVNLASRLESLTKYYGQTLIVSEVIANICRDEFAFQELDKVRVKGKVKPITIFTAMRREDAALRTEELRNYADALALYRGMRFAEAQTAFVALCEKYADQALYALYRERCENLQSAPPQSDWDGVFTHKTK
ncbi:MAG: CHASE2 domain-containing protein [Desulfovibrio sp.]